MEHSDPPGMPEDERMQPVELKTIREWLGLGEDWLAAHLHVPVTTVWAWEDGSEPIPDTARQEVEHLEAQTAATVTQAVEVLRDARDPAIRTYLSDEQYGAHEPGQNWPASWHRRVVARVAQEVPGLVIVAPED